MQKIIKVDKTVIAVLSNGRSYQRNDITQEQFEVLCEATTDEEIIMIMDTEYGNSLQEVATAKKLISTVQDSEVLIMKEDCVYWSEISMLSLPKELVTSILDAENNNDELRLETYKNFWTLMSLNPDEECRKNLFWFLERNGLVISRCGFFIAYRNAASTSEEGVFTDAHSHTFKIRIGEAVTMNREECDSSQDVTCSRGLHLGARTWLKVNYCGNTGLTCLCNPADVCAVPKLDHYGKLRTCAYLPIDFAKFDSKGDVIPYDAQDGFDCSYVTKVIYEGLMGTEEDSDYQIIIPEIPEITKESMADRLLDIARECIVNREI